MGVATGSRPQSTYFRIPSEAQDGVSEIRVIANGIPSNAIRVEIGPPIYDPIQALAKAFVDIQLIGNLADGQLFIFGPHGLEPVPPFGPKIDEKTFRQKILSAYEIIFSGLIGLECVGRMEDEHQSPEEGSFFNRQTAVQQIEVGLRALRKLGDEKAKANAEFPNKLPAIELDKKKRQNADKAARKRGKH
jgi:hypothetical protein